MLPARASRSSGACASSRYSGDEAAVGQIPRAGHRDDRHKDRPANVSHVPGAHLWTRSAGDVHDDDGLCARRR